MTTFQGGLQQAVRTRVEHGRHSQSGDFSVPDPALHRQKSSSGAKGNPEGQGRQEKRGCKVQLLQEMEQGGLPYERVKECEGVCVRMCLRQAFSFCSM